jgi:hypothetical protein
MQTYEELKCDTATYCTNTFCINNVNGDLKKSWLPDDCFVIFHESCILLINNYSPKARWLSVNKNRDEVEVFIHDNHQARGE